MKYQNTKLICEKIRVKIKVTKMIYLYLYKVYIKNVVIIGYVRM